MSVSSNTIAVLKVLSYVALMLCVTAAFRHTSKYLHKPSPATTGRLTRMMATVKRVNVKEFGDIVKGIDFKDKYQVIDVRETHELEAVSIPQLKQSPAFHHLPLSTSDVWADQVANGELLEKDKSTIVICHHGMRSMRMASFLGKP